MKKTTIVSVDIRNDNSVVVYYSTGTCKPYRSKDKLPKTVATWLADHPEPAPVTVSATPEGVEIRTADQDAATSPDSEKAEAPEAIEMEPITADPEQAEIKGQEILSFDSTPAPAECTAIVVATPEPVRMATEVAPAIISPPATVDAEITPPERVRLAPLAVVELAALGVAYNGLIGLALASHAAAIAAEIAEATVKVVQDIGTDTGTAIHRTGHCLRRTAGRIRQVATRATRMAETATGRAWGIISTNAVQTATSVAIWAREAWAWREELVTAETVIG